MSHKRPIVILCLEDNEGDRLILKTAFEEVGDLRIRLHFCANGKLALQWLAKSPIPSLIISDIQMPEMGGLEFLEIVKNNPKLRQIPVVVLSSSTFSGDINTAYLHHCSSYLPKPLDFDEMLALTRVLHLLWFRHSRLPTYDDA